MSATSAASHHLRSASITGIAGSKAREISPQVTVSISRSIMFPLQKQRLRMFTEPLCIFFDHSITLSSTT